MQHIRRPRSKPTARGEQIQALFDAVERECGIREHAIFFCVYKDPREAGKRLTKFLKQVGTCPHRIERYCQELLQAKKRPSPTG